MEKQIDHNNITCTAFVVLLKKESLFTWTLEWSFCVLTHLATIVDAESQVTFIEVYKEIRKLEFNLKQVTKVQPKVICLNDKSALL